MNSLEGSKVEFEIDIEEMILKDDKILVGSEEEEKQEEKGIFAEAKENLCLQNG